MPAVDDTGQWCPPWTAPVSGARRERHRSGGARRGRHLSGARRGRHRSVVPAVDAIGGAVDGTGAVVPAADGTETVMPAVDATGGAVDGTGEECPPWTTQGRWCPP
ncbi:hypothetical protein V3C99_000526 [Haemonchus contortus]